MNLIPVTVVNVGSLFDIYLVLLLAGILIRRKLVKLVKTSLQSSCDLVKYLFGYNTPVHELETLLCTQ